MTKIPDMLCKPHLVPHCKLCLQPSAGTINAADALQEWLHKTSWFKPQTHELGLHKADAIYQRLQYYIGLAARRSIELRLVEQLLDDPHKEFTALDMEYWTTMHDQLLDKLVNNPWQQAIDYELVLAGIGIAQPDDSPETCRQKLLELIHWHIEVATDPKTNGGYELTRTKS